MIFVLVRDLFWFVIFVMFFVLVYLVCICIDLLCIYCIRSASVWSLVLFVMDCFGFAIFA